MKKRILILLLVMLSLAACSQEKKDDGKGDAIYPLTGLETNEEVDQRPIAVMVNNHPEARPQSGLSQADLVFELLVEGNMTRFLAIYQSEFPEVVGPVRSAREYYFDLAEAYDALYVYHGAANFVEDMIETRDVENLNGATYDDDGVLFKRESFRKPPHNSYLQMNAANEAAEEKGYDTTMATSPLKFSNEDVTGDTAESVTIDYSSSWTVQYQYDEENQLYDRSSDGEETVELDTEEPIQAANVLIIEANHEVIDDEGRQAIDLESGGEAYLIQKGKVQQVEWAMKENGIVPVKDGEELEFVPGQTWINVLPTSPGLEQAVTISSH